MSIPFNYDGRRFTRSDIAVAAEAIYGQEGNLLSGTFSGGDVRFGCLCGTVDAGGVLTFSYSMVDWENTVISGHCRSTPERDGENRISLREEWVRFTPTASRGISYLKEIP